jgi:hypothetical protein
MLFLSISKINYFIYLFIYLLKYAKQKGTLKDDLIKFLNKMNPLKDLSTAYPSDVRMFLVVKEKEEKKVHRLGCAFISKKQKKSKCDCPLRRSAGSVDSLIDESRKD